MSEDRLIPESHQRYATADFWRYAGIGVMVFLIFAGLGACQIGAGLYEHYSGKPAIQFEMRRDK